MNADGRIDGDGPIDDESHATTRKLNGIAGNRTGLLPQKSQLNGLITTNTRFETTFHMGLIGTADDYISAR